MLWFRVKRTIAPLSTSSWKQNPCGEAEIESTAPLLVTFMLLVNIIIDTRDFNESEEPSFHAMLGILDLLFHVTNKPGTNMTQGFQTDKSRETLNLTMYMIRRHYFHLTRAG